MPCKLLAFDLDGTLLNDSGELTPGNMAAIRRAKEAGLNVIIASGRSHSSISKFNQALGLTCENSFGISFNGAVVYKTATMEILHETRLGRAECEKIYKAVKAYDPDAPLILYTPRGDKVYYEVENANIDKYYQHTNMRWQRVPSLLELTTEGAAKFLVRQEPEEIIRMQDAISAELSDVCELVSSAPHLLEFGVRGNNKACGLKFLTDYLGINMEEVATAGDNYNDLEMIEAAGVGFAVANAVDELKAVADYVTVRDNNTDVAEEIIAQVLK